MATTGTPRKDRIEAWIVGKHQLPHDEIPPAVLNNSRVGDVIVRTGKQWNIMSRDNFDREYEWA